MFASGLLAYATAGCQAGKSGRSSKLEERSKRTVMMITGVDYEQASKALVEAGGHVKTALVMLLGGVGADEARNRLKRSDGFVRKAIQ